MKMTVEDLIGQLTNLPPDSHVSFVNPSPYPVDTIKLAINTGETQDHSGAMHYVFIPISQ